MIQVIWSLEHCERTKVARSDCRWYLGYLEDQAEDQGLFGSIVCKVIEVLHCQQKQGGFADFRSENEDGGSS